MFRPLVSMTLLVSLVALGSSGMLMIVLGSLEFQLQMHPVHKIFGILMTVSGLLHLYLNFGGLEKAVRKRRPALYLTGLTVVMVLLYAVGMSKPIDAQKVQEIEGIMQTLEQ